MRPLSNASSRCLPRASTRLEDAPVEHGGEAGRRLGARDSRVHALTDERREAQRRQLEGVALGQG